MALRKYKLLLYEGLHLRLFFLCPWQFEKKILTDEAVKQLAEKEEGKESAEKMCHLKTEMQNTKTLLQRWKVRHSCSDGR